MTVKRSRIDISDIDQLIDRWPGSAIAPVQLSAGPLALRLEGVSHADLSVMHLKVGPRMADHVCIDPDRTGFMLAERPTVWGGIEVAPQSLLVARSGQDYRSLLEPGYRSIEFFCSNSSLRRHPLGRLLEATGLAPLAIGLGAEHAVRLRSAASVLIGLADASDLASQDLCATTLAQRRVFDALESIVACHLGRPEARTGGSTPARCALAFAALEAIDRIGACDAKVSDLHQSLGVSRRTLEKSFECVLGVSPGQYLLACRLHHFRLNLLSGAERVSDSLFESGFTDASRAARQYRRLFGELPSSTLRRSRVRLVS